MDDLDIRMLIAGRGMDDILIKSKNDIWYYIFDKKIIKLRQ